MNDKTNSVQPATEQENSRRGFLKTGAVLAGAALLAGKLNPAEVSATEKSNPETAEVQYLFVQNAQDVNIKDGKLSLIGISPTTIFFADRPKRIAGHMHTEDFIEDWQKDTGKESFHTDPPNGTLSVFGGDEVVDVVLTLKNPRMTDGNLIYDIAVLEEDNSIPSGPASLFIDPIGRPLSPGSIAGVRRRTRRRTRRRMVRRAVVMGY
jgi:hypothetical protein